MSATVVVIGLVALVAFVAIFMARANNKHQEIDQKLKSLPDFTPAVSIIQASLTSALAIDLERKKLAIVRALGNSATEWRHFIYPFDEIVAVELVRNGSSIIKTQRGSQVAGAAIGGVLLGPAGLIVGGLSGSKTQQDMIEKLSLRIYVNDLLAPVQEVIFLNYPNSGIPPHLVQAAVMEIEQWHGRIKILIDRH